MIKKTLLIIGLLAFYCCLPVLADITISFNDLNMVEHSDVEIYGLNETSSDWELLGIYNTATPGLVFSNGTYQIIIKGTAISRVTNPVTFLTDAFGFMETYWLQILLAFSLIVLILRKW